MGAEGCEVRAAKAESATGAKLKLAPGQSLPADLAKEIEVIIARYDGNPSSLINILHEVQKTVGFLPEPILIHVAEKLGVSVVDVQGVVSFYTLFTTDDAQFSLDIVRCLGACGLGPVAMVGDGVHARLKPDRISAMLKPYR